MPRGPPSWPAAGSTARAPGGQLDHAAAEQDQRQPLPDGGGRDRPGQQVGHPARGVRAAPPARAEQRPARLHGDRRDGGPGAGSRAEHPQRRGTGQEQRRQGQDHDQPGHDERRPAGQRAEAAADPPGAEDRQLGGGRAREQVAGRDRVLEFPRVQPFPALDAQFPQQLDVGGRAAEPDAADPAPLPQHRGQGHPRRRGSRTGRDRLRAAGGVLGQAHRSGVRLARRRAGTARPRCRRGPRPGSASRRAGDDLVAEAHPFGAQPGDLRLDVVDDEVDAVPAARPGLAPVGHRPTRGAGRAGQQQPQVTPADVGERGHRAEPQREAEVAGVEVDGRLDVIDHVADVHYVVRACHHTSWWAERAGVAAIAASRKPIRASSSAAVAWKAG